MQLTTKDNYNMYDMASLMQKAIRRNDWKKAGFAANQLFHNYYHFAWRRLIIISAEDCDGVITKEITALWEACKEINKKNKMGEKDMLFFSKAIMLLAKHPKNRDAVYFTLNFAIPMSDEEIKQIDFEELTLEDGIPDYTYDCHTWKGTARGKKVEDMVEEEQEALEPKQLGLFDDASWETFYDRVVKGEMGEKYAKKSRRYTK